MSFSALDSFLQVHHSNIVAKSASILILAGLAFKIGAFPFQMWVADVYQGAPVPVTAFLSTASKSAGLIVLFNILDGPLRAMQDFLYPILTIMACVSILWSNITATTQRNVKRLMGLSGISHAGYILILIIANPSVFWAKNILIVYLFAYMLASLCTFGVMAKVCSASDAYHTLDDYRILFKRSPVLAFALLISIGSLAGAPPLFGFIAKALLFIVAFKASLYSLLGVAILGVVISMYYYFNWIREIFFISSSCSRGMIPPPIKLGKSLTSFIVVLMITILLLGCVQFPLGSLLKELL